MKIKIFLFLILMLAACSPLPGEATMPPDTAVTSPPEDEFPTAEPRPNPLAPRPGDDQLTRGEVYLNESSLLIRESYPPQIALSIDGDLPTPCHELRAVIAEPDQENKIVIELYSLSDPNTVCTQVLEPFEAQIELGTFPSGHYTVWVNDEMVGEFDS